MPGLCMRYCFDIVQTCIKFSYVLYIVTCTIYICENVTTPCWVKFFVVVIFFVALLFLLSCSHIFNHLDISYKWFEIGHDQNEDIFIYI